MKMRFFMVIALFAAACNAQDAGPSGNVLTNRDVVTLADAGFGQEFIVEIIGTSRTEFDTTADDAKAYEMMSNLVGLAGLYRVTGNPVYLETAQTAWKDIA